MTPTPPALPDGYADWLKQLKSDIARAQQRAALAVNGELVQICLSDCFKQIMCAHWIPADPRMTVWGAK